MAEIMILKEDLAWLENTLNEIAKDDICEELSDCSIIEDLHDTCETADEYYEVIDFLKKNTGATRNDVIGVLAGIGKRHLGDFASTLTESELAFLEHRLREIEAADTSSEFDECSIIQCLHLSCEDTDDYYRVIKFLKEHPCATATEIADIFLDIIETHLTG